MLIAEPKTERPFDRLMAELFNQVHSTDAFMSGIKLALVLNRPVHFPNADHGPVQVYVIHDGKVSGGRTSFQSFVSLAAKLTGNDVVDTLLARWGLPPDVESALCGLGYRREIAGQVSGYWYAKREEIPTEMPGTIPTGAVIPPKGHRLARGGVCLDLVLVDYQWYPLSEAGIYSYGHSSDLDRGVSMLFVPVDSRETPWPTPFVTTLDEPIPPGKVSGAYGPEAAARVRQDFAAVRVRLAKARRS